MAVPAIQRKLNPLIEDSPKDNAASLHRKATLYRVASIASYVAIVAIAAVALATSFGILTAVPPLAIFLLTASAIALNLAASKCSNLARDHLNKAQIEDGVVKELDRFIRENWTEENIADFFDEHELPQLDELSKNQLQSLVPGKDPKLALLPAMARFSFWNNLAHELNVQCLVDLRQQHDVFPNGNYDEIKDNMVRCPQWEAAWCKLESMALPAYLRAARMLQIISHPTSDISLDQGKIIARDFGRRKIVREFADDHSDAYLIQGPVDLNLDELVDIINLEDTRGIRKRLYDPAPGAADEAEENA